MTLDTVMRIMVGAAGILFAFFLVLALVTGKTSLNGRKVTKAEAPRLYWAVFGALAIFATAFILFATLKGERYSPLLVMGLMGGLLFQALVSGEVQTLKGPATRGDPGYRFWVILLSVLLALILLLVAVELIWFRGS